ncbi:MAG: SufS family cysteine desulfurase [Bacteriovoracaceae bacterium]|nr:SufS family cysteine desulfurase [Bacteriovoracaceae bacterium]
MKNLETLRKQNNQWRGHFDSLLIPCKKTHHPWIFFDNAATSLKPNSVIDAVVKYYRELPVNIHRSVHELGEEATAIYENTRDEIQTWIKAKKREEIIFTRGTTESLNLVAHGYAKKFLNAGDEIFLSTSEHHSNIVSWQIALKDLGIKITPIPLNHDGTINLEELKSATTEHTKMISYPAISNVLGIINPINEIRDWAKSKGIITVIDGAQAAVHSIIDVLEWDADFVAFSGHKMLGPTGIGILYGKEKWLEQMDPLFGGGDMIDQVAFDKTTYNQLPYKFEAGTPSIGEVFGLGAAVKFIKNLDQEALLEWDKVLMNKMEKVFQELDVFTVLGDLKHKSTPLYSFYAKAFHSHDVAQLLSQFGIAIRSGHLCAQPLMKSFGVTAVARASLAFYNNEDEIERFGEALKKTKAMLQ